jgi:hypothetical protein
VATSSWFANASRFLFAHSSNSSFRLSCATKATRFVGTIFLTGILLEVQNQYHQLTSRLAEQMQFKLCLEKAKNLQSMVKQKQSSLQVKHLHLQPSFVKPS